ncbi:penicillin-binding protein 2 [Elusimicrobiota bacterium]
MRSSGLFHERLNLLWIGCYCMGVILGVRLLHVQVIRNVYYSRVAESNRTQIIPQTAPRGRVYDRHGEVIATSRPAFSLIYLPGKARDTARLQGLAESLAVELHEERGDLLERLKEARREESAIHLAENLPLKAMFRLSELKSIYPGVDLIVEARRYYPKGAFAGHLLGYMGKMDKRSWRKLRARGYRVDSWIGQSGIEKDFEGQLRGRSGEIRMEVDAQGRLKRKLDQIPWKPGANVHLTIDARIQEAVEKGLRETPTGAGAAVVLDPRNGEVLALASIPEYDPNLFLLPEWDKAKDRLSALPEFNRAVSGAYAPGSTFKIVVGAAMLEERKVHPKDSVFCRGGYRVGRRVFRCWEKKGHRRVDWLAGITHSCDVYFYQMGLRTGGELIEDYTKRFHLGVKTGIRMDGERKGNVFGPKEREAQVARKGRWHDGDTANLSIGQGELLATPVQMAVLIAAVANRGTLWTPHFVSKIEYPDGTVIETPDPEPAGRVELRPDTWDRIREGLVSVVKNGTGRRVNVRELAVAGKTGTTQNPHGEDHGWFVAYAGREGEEPSLAVSVLAEHGEHGSSGAGPVVRRAIEAAFQLADARKPASRRSPASRPASPAAASSGQVPSGEPRVRPPAAAEPAPDRPIPDAAPAAPPADPESPVFGDPAEADRAEEGSL